MSSEFERGKTPALLIKPWVGLIPTSPQAAEGNLTDPPVSDPKAAGIIPEATIAADPDDDPPQT